MAQAPEVLIVNGTEVTRQLFEALPEYAGPDVYWRPLGRVRDAVGQRWYVGTDRRTRALVRCRVPVDVSEAGFQMVTRIVLSEVRARRRA